MDKSPDAFRTISEVAEVLETPAHVLRFWESRFPQIRPVKRAGGRRYYRPADVALLTGIKRLLHDEGMTIRGVQKILREQGVRHVAGLSGQVVPDETEDAEAALEAALAANFGSEADEAPPQAEVETAQIVALETALRDRAEGATLPVATPAEVVPLFEQRAEPAADAPPAASVAEAAHWLDPDLVDAGTSAPVTAPDESPQADLFAAAPAAASLPADAPLIDRLRALPPASLAGNAEAKALHARLLALRSRLEAPPQRLPL